MAKPEKRFKFGRCEAAVFGNPIMVDGIERVVKKVSFQKRYLDSDGNWSSTTSLDINDIPKAILALQKAYEYLVVGNEGDSNAVNNTQ